MNEIVWQPSENTIETSRLRDYMRYLSHEAIIDCDSYDSLWHWSVTELDSFWSSIWDFTDIIGERGTIAYQHHDLIRKARFFPEAHINYAENMLRYQGAEEALIFSAEDGRRYAWSHDDLRSQVSRLQQAFRAAGIGKGDRVAGLVPNTPEAIAFMLAAVSVGAIWSSCSPDFGLSAAMDRLDQIAPKILICANGYHYNGKSFSSLALAEALYGAMASVRQVVVFSLIDTDEEGLFEGAIHWDDFIAPYQAGEIVYEAVPFDHPLYIMFSSGTTGLPKCIVHSHGGTMMNHKKEMVLHADMKEGDRLFYFTTCGWMMWNWSISALMCGASLVLYDGSPFYPEPARFAKLIAAEHVTHFGTSAKYIDACAKANLSAKDEVGLSRLRMIFSTGSPLAAEGFDYIYQNWKADLCLASIAGGTDILGCFVGGSAISPVYRGQCQKRLLGMSVAVFDEAGNAIEDAKGELVCLAPHPSMPVKFWNDEDGARYHKAYFAKFENVWHHGDCVSLTRQGGMIFYGRSDATLNPGGVRIGTAEIYRQVESLDVVLEALVIGQEWDNDQRVVLFVKLRDGVALDEGVKTQIKTQIRQNATPRHVPAIIIAVPDIPRTKSGKITELAVRDIVHGKAVENVGALANPEALAHFKDRPELA